MRKANPFARLILRTGTSEKVEDTLVILGRNAPAIVAHVDPHPPRRLPFGAYLDLDRPISGTIFHRVVNQIAKNLVERKTIRQNFGYVDLDLNLAFRFRNLMMHGGGCRFQESLKVDPLRFERPAAFPRYLEDGIDQAVHLAGGTAYEADRFRQVLGRGGSRFFYFLLTQRLAVRKNIGLDRFHRFVQFGGAAHAIP